MSTTLEQEQVIGQKPIEQEVLARISVAPRGFGEISRTQAYSVSESGVIRSAIVPGIRVLTRVPMDIGGLFFATNSLGPAKYIVTLSAPETGVRSASEARWVMSQSPGVIIPAPFENISSVDFGQWRPFVAGISGLLRETAGARVKLSPASEKYAKFLRAYGSLILAKELVLQTIPSVRRLMVDRQDDPDPGGYPVIRFTIITSEPVERVLELDDQLQEAFCREIPPRHQPYFTFTYQSDA